MSSATQNLSWHPLLGAEVKQQEQNPSHQEPFSVLTGFSKEAELDGEVIASSLSSR